MWRHSTICCVWTQKSITRRSGGAMVWRRCFFQCLLHTPLSLQVDHKLLAGCQRKWRCTKLSSRPIRRIGLKTWWRRGRLRSRSKLMWPKIEKLLQKHLHSLFWHFRNFVHHLLRLRMWEQWGKKKWHWWRDWGEVEELVHGLAGNRN